MANDPRPTPGQHTAGNQPADSATNEPVGNQADDSVAGSEADHSATGDGSGHSATGDDAAQSATGNHAAQSAPAFDTVQLLTPEGELTHHHRYSPLIEALQFDDLQQMYR